MKVKILSGARKRLHDQLLAELKAEVLKTLQGIPQEERPAAQARLARSLNETADKWEAENAERARACKPKIIPFRERAAST